MFSNGDRKMQIWQLRHSHTHTKWMNLSWWSLYPSFPPRHCCFAIAKALAVGWALLIHQLHWVAWVVNVKELKSNDMLPPSRERGQARVVRSHAWRLSPSKFWKCEISPSPNTSGKGQLPDMERRWRRGRLLCGSAAPTGQTRFLSLHRWVLFWQNL